MRTKNQESLILWTALVCPHASLQYEVHTKPHAEGRKSKTTSPAHRQGGASAPGSAAMGEPPQGTKLIFLDVSHAQLNLSQRNSDHWPSFAAASRPCGVFSFCCKCC